MAPEDMKSLLHWKGRAVKAEVAFKELEKEREELIGEMLDCDLVVDSPLEGFRKATDAMLDQISVTSKYRERAERAEKAEARVAELEAIHPQIEGKRLTQMDVHQLVVERDRNANRVAELKDLAEDMYPLIGAQFDLTDEVKSINARFDVLVEGKEASDGN